MTSLPAYFLALFTMSSLVGPSGRFTMVRVRPLTGWPRVAASEVW